MSKGKKTSRDAAPEAGAGFEVVGKVSLGPESAEGFTQETDSCRLA